VHLLWAQGNAEAAIQVEKLGNQLPKTCDLDILCGYSLDSVHGGMDTHILNESVPSIQPFMEPKRLFRATSRTMLQSSLRVCATQLQEC